jgi:PAS domain S-box-containing protein
VAHVDPAKVALARELQQRYPPDLDAPTGAPNVALRTGESELYAEITPELLERAGADEEQVRIIRDLGMTSAMVVPLRARGRVLGALTLIATEGRERYGPEDVAFAEQIAARAAMAVDNARLYREVREQERRSEEARALLDTLIDQAPIGVAFLDREGRYVRVNDALAEINGIPAADHLGRRVEEVVPDVGAAARAHIEQALAGGEKVANAEVSRPNADGTLSHYLVSYYPVKLAGGEALSDSAMIDVLGRDGRIRRLGAASKTPDGHALLARLGERNRLQAASEHPIARTMREQQATFLDDPADRYMRDVARAPAELERFREAAGRSLAVVPLVARGRSVGALSVGWRPLARRPPRDEWNLIEALAQRIALAVDSAPQYQERAYVARTLQQSLLPGTLPTVPGADLAAEYVAAGEGMEVGGDFFDVFAVGGQNEWALVIGDVCSNGAEAAAVTAFARYTLPAVTSRSPSPAATLATLNDEMLRQMPEPRFLTAGLGHLAVRPEGGGRLTLASGGHHAPVVLRASGTPEVAECHGMLLGVDPDARAVDCAVDLAPGDAIVLYTDGISEAGPDRPLPSAALAEALQPVLPEGAAAIACHAVALAEERARGPLRDVAVPVLRLTER